MNPIVRAPYASSVFTRTFHMIVGGSSSAANKNDSSRPGYSSYKHPVTIELVGANSRLLGIRVLLFNTDRCEE